MCSPATRHAPRVQISARLASEEDAAHEVQSCKCDAADSGSGHDSSSSPSSDLSRPAQSAVLLLELHVRPASLPCSSTDVWACPFPGPVNQCDSLTRHLASSASRLGRGCAEVHLCSPGGHTGALYGHLRFPLPSLNVTAPSSVTLQVSSLHVQSSALHSHTNPPAC
jgi:hypothetical protein